MRRVAQRAAGLSCYVATALLVLHSVPPARVGAQGAELAVQRALPGCTQRWWWPLNTVCTLQRWPLIPMVVWW